MMALITRASEPQRRPRPLGRRGALGIGGETPAHPIEHPAEALPAERLDQIVERAKLERGDRVLIVGGREHHFGLVADLLEHLETGHFRQTNVEDDERRLQAIETWNDPRGIYFLCECGLR